jgi:hypothetical protein
LDGEVGNFERHLPDYYLLVKKEIKQLEHDQMDLTHDCDCDYCDLKDEVPEDQQGHWDKIYEMITERQALLKSLEGWAKLHRINLEDNKAISKA